MSTCYHCGNPCYKSAINYDDKVFCCRGCQMVYSLLQDYKLDGTYYSLENAPGQRLEQKSSTRYNFLENDKVREQLLEFDSDEQQIISFHIPQIHCSSCIWLLEHLHKIHQGVYSSVVNFPGKTVRIIFSKSELSLKALADLLATIGYPPYISLEQNIDKQLKSKDRRLIYKLGVAGFAFGNVMLLSFPEYFEVDEFWLNQYKPFFRWLMLILSVPVFFYAASDYFIAAYRSMRSRVIGIDMPIALGILTLFVRSLSEVIIGSGQGFFDSMTGLVFFLLLGRWFQQKTYAFLSFERDYKSYFPIGVTRIADGQEESIHVNEVKKGHRLLIRHQELIPVDGVLVAGEAAIDYSFVTGESDLVVKTRGDKIFAGGRQTGGAIEISVLKSISQSYFIGLWSNEIFSRPSTKNFQTLTDRISKYFTIIILLLALGSGLFWFWIDSSRMLEVFTAVLIIACPCALALSAPFALGNMLRLFGIDRLYLRETQVIEKMNDISHIIFDKTGTLTSQDSHVSYQGEPLTDEEKVWINTALRQSNHPLSRQLYETIETRKIISEGDFEEVIGQGIKFSIGGHYLKIGSSDFVGIPSKEIDALHTHVCLSIDNNYRGKYVFKYSYREGIGELFQQLSSRYHLAVLSGDNESQRERLEKILPTSTKLIFGQSPQDKLDYIHSLQLNDARVMMVGDGLNDAGALKQSDVGIAVSEQTNVFFPSCDGIVHSSVLSSLDRYMKLSRIAIRIVQASFAISLVYNVVGLSFAMSGQLSAVVAAILMPLSSVSVVIFTTLIGRWVYRYTQIRSSK